MLPGHPMVSGAQAAAAYLSPGGQLQVATALSSQTITSLLPCLESSSAATSDAAFDRLVEEREKLTVHIAGLTRTLESLNELIDANRAHRAASGTGRSRGVPDDSARQ